MAVLMLKHQILLLLLLSAIAACTSDDNQSPSASEILTRALWCFNRQNIYKKCQDSYQLNAQGVIDVPREATDDYCGGPCLTETELVLDCVDGILSNFLFYNGASTRDVRYTIRSACGHSGSRGNFDVLGRLNYGGEYGGYYFNEGFRVEVVLGSWVLIGAVFFLHN